ncbi:amine sulfotransferase-like [Ambystoma mexicanum]|uniref:amine sulfotransferase-like n=1 Tax=Ambystoma mexicanum TaxID=8296 RepID=UPI0037E9C0BF
MTKATDSSDANFIKHSGFNLLRNGSTPEYIDAMFEEEIRDSDVLQVTYPKSGTVWMNQILCLIYNSNHRNGSENIPTLDQIPSIEYNFKHVDLKTRPSPRLMCTHLPYNLVPNGFRQKKGKVIYVYRNPKDALTSLYHFSKAFVPLKEFQNFEEAMDHFLSGNVGANSWFDHVKGYHEHRDEFNILFLVYEEMVKDLKSNVLRLCEFLGKPLEDAEVNMVVERATFKNMISDPMANCDSLPSDILQQDRVCFLRKGKIGDWKNIMTVAQNERFDRVFQERMKDLKHLAIRLIWDDEDEGELSPKDVQHEQHKEDATK